MSFYLVTIGGIEASASIGIHGFEKTARQRFLVSVVLLLDRPPRGDDVANVQDYDFVREGVLKLAASRHYNLQETFCEDVLDLCMAQPKVRGAVVQTDKPDVYPGVQSVSCRMARGAAEEPPFAWWSVDV
jgi:7,8-dihydroneopterin aldolase/epimerase/oxygenase